MSIKFDAHGSVAELMTLNNILQESPKIQGVKAGQLFRSKNPNNARQRFEVLAEESERYEFISRKRDTSGYVYLLQTGEEGIYKIGKTKDPANRKRTFGVLLPFNVDYLHLIPSDNMHRDERRLHQRFASKRLINSEFFQLSPSDVAYICSL